VQMVAGQQDLARRSFEAARLELEQKVTQDPNDSRFHSSLGIAYAGLGSRVEAVREAKLGCELMPASKDAWQALNRLEDLAVVYTMVAQSREAIAQLEDLLVRSGQFTTHVLRLDPRWDALRADPKFQALLAKYEVKP
jgi:predicted Zn-dependent protease